MHPPKQFARNCVKNLRYYTLNMTNITIEMCLYVPKLCHLLQLLEFVTYNWKIMLDTIEMLRKSNVGEDISLTILS